MDCRKDIGESRVANEEEEIWEGRVCYERR